MAPESLQPAETLTISQILRALDIDGPAAGGESDTYYVIPGNSGPRWLIPKKSRASAAVLSDWKPYGRLSQIKWIAIRFLARAGILHLAGSVSSIAISRADSMRWFERCGIDSSTEKIIILAGNPSPTAKLIVFLPKNAYRIAAVAKVGATTEGGLRVLREAEVLRRLEQFSWAPKALPIHTDLVATAQEYVHGAIPDRRFRPQYVDLLCRLPRDGNSKGLTSIAEEMRRKLAPFEADVEAKAPGLLYRALDLLNCNLELPTILVHGDFAPWNLRHNRQAGYVLVDWERADFAGLPAHDLLHFHFNNDYLFPSKVGGYPVIREKPECSGYLRAMDLDPGLLPQLAITYLLEQLVYSCTWGGDAHAGYVLTQLQAIVDAPRSRHN